MQAAAGCLCRFAVVPLTEETGIIEWVPQTHGLRHCCQDIYIADGTYDKRTVNMTVKKIYDGFQVVCCWSHHDTQMRAYKSKQYQTPLGVQSEVSKASLTAG